MARLSIALALLATAHAFTGPLAPRAPQHKGLIQQPQKGVRNWLTKLKAAVAEHGLPRTDAEWRRISDAVGTRDSKKCYQKWLHLASPPRRVRHCNARS